MIIRWFSLYNSSKTRDISFTALLPRILLHAAKMSLNLNRNPPMTKIEDGLYLGDSISSRRRGILKDSSITPVVSLSDGRWIYWSQPWYKEIIHKGNHLFIPCNDSMTNDLLRSEPSE